ncbi:hypothetical protein [Pseudomonas sp. DWRC2-2]|uniref:hypothetical protein n=1 Tax=Pseudomonas sp. DWRC2-2 TaxID=2804567 RepID=UPI003CED1910
MALMIVDFGDGDISEIEISEIHSDDSVPNELRQMGDWLGEVAQDAAEYLSVTDQLQKSDWVKNDETRPLLRKLYEKSLGLQALPFDGHIKEFYTWIKQPGVMARLPKATTTLFDSSGDSKIASEMHKVGVSNEEVREFFANMTQLIIRERDAVPQETKQQQFSVLREELLELTAKTSERTAEFITYDRAITEAYRSASTHRSLLTELTALHAHSLQPVYLEDNVFDSSNIEINQTFKLYPEFSAKREPTGRTKYKDRLRHTFEVGMTRC